MRTLMTTVMTVVNKGAEKMFNDFPPEEST